MKFTIQEAIDAGYTHLATYKTIPKIWASKTDKNPGFPVEYNPETGEYLANGGMTSLLNVEENFKLTKLTDLLETSI